MIMFTDHFDTFACAGDSIACTLPDGRIAVATIHYDDDQSAPDQQMDGFWPSLNPNDAGFIGHKSRSTLRRHRKHAEFIMSEHERGALFYCGVVVQLWDGYEALTQEYEFALWGIECNWPVFRKSVRKNSYLRDVANELLAEILA